LWFRRHDTPVIQMKENPLLKVRQGHECPLVILDSLTADRFRQSQALLEGLKVEVTP
jgi:hypothetical protein